MKIKIGTRGSKLALWQAEMVAKTLQKGGLETEIVIIETKGDKILDRSLSKIGSKGVFTEELEDKLRNGDIDIAQHSAKDLQSHLADDLELIALMQREAVNDVLVSFNNTLRLGSGTPFVVGTSSTRRVAMLKAYYPHIQVVDMRGNLVTRLQKLRDGACDALLLAYAGVHRMGYAEHIAEHISPNVFIPAVGQGSVAIECAVNLDSKKKYRVRQLLNHEPTERCILAERAFLKTLQGGCSVPVFGLCSFENEDLHLIGGVLSLDGTERIIQQMKGVNAGTLGQTLAEKVAMAGGKDILDRIKIEIN